MTKRKARILSDNSCKIRLKDGSHKMVDMYPLKERKVTKIDNDGDKYIVEEQDFIIIDDEKLIGFLINPIQSDDILNDVYDHYIFFNIK